MAHPATRHDRRQFLAIGASTFMWPVASRVAAEACFAAKKATEFPLKLSENRRYLVDHKGKLRILRTTGCCH